MERLNEEESFLYSIIIKKYNVVKLMHTDEEVFYFYFKDKIMRFITLNKLFAMINNLYELGADTNYLEKMYAYIVSNDFHHRFKNICPNEFFSKFIINVTEHKELFFNLDYFLKIKSIKNILI